MNDCDNDNDLMPPALQVVDTGEEFDLDIPPTSGMEYLRRVQVEAKQCPSVVVANIDSNLLKKKQTVHVNNCSGLQPAPRGYAPCLDWQRQQVADFSEVRQKLVRYKARLKKEAKKPSVLLPKKDDVQGWCGLCFGKLHVSRDNRLTTVEHETAMEQNHDSTAPHTGTPPLLSIVAYMDQTTIMQVLEYHTNWFEVTGFSHQQGKWLYALLACLEKPLDPEACAQLRKLARNCANLRATFDSQSNSHLEALNMFICLVARYFDQKDLGDGR